MNVIFLGISSLFNQNGPPSLLDWEAVDFKYFCSLLEAWKTTTIELQNRVCHKGERDTIKSLEWYKNTFLNCTYLYKIVKIQTQIKKSVLWEIYNQNRLDSNNHNI